MIQITYEKSANRVTVSGHAGAAAKGSDIVCAAVSALVLTLGENIRVLHNTGVLTAYTVDVKEGSAVLSCKAIAGMESVVRCIFGAVCCGFDLVQNMHPENVRYTEKFKIGN